MTWTDPEWLLLSFGSEFYWMAVVIIAIESGLFPFLPGDSLLFAIGLFIASDQLTLFPGSWGAELILAIAALAVAGSIGNVLGYEAGRRLGPWLLARDGRILDRRSLDQVDVFFARYGNKSLVIGRFLPYVRTYISVAAGAKQMDRGRFAFWSALGTFGWVATVTLLGFTLAAAVPAVGDNIHLSLTAVLVFTLVPIVVEAIRYRRTHAPGAEIGPHDGGPDRDITGRNLD